MTGDPAIRDADPFDLPSWVGESEVVWTAESGERCGHHITGHLGSAGTDAKIACDLLAIDQAYPRQVASSDWRRRAHLAWHNGEVLLIEYAGRPTLACPGHEFTADLVLTALGRLAKAVGGRPERFTAALRLGAVGLARGAR